MSRVRQRLAVLVCALLAAAAMLVAATPAYAVDPPGQVKGNSRSTAYYDKCGQFWPDNIRFYTSSSTSGGTTTYTAKIEFSLSQALQDHLYCVGKLLEIDFVIYGFIVPAYWEGYTLTSTNLPGVIHDSAAQDDGGAVASPAITGIDVKSLVAGTTYYGGIQWSLPTSGTTSPGVAFNWVPSHFTTNPADWFVCTTIGWLNPANCVFSTTVAFLSRPYFTTLGPNNTTIGIPAPIPTDVSVTALSTAYNLPPFAEAPPQDAATLSLGDGTVLHGSDGSLWVMAGGAKFYFGSMTEFYNLGYSTSNMSNVTTAQLSTISNMPRDGTVLRSGGGQLYVTAGGAKFYFGSWGEFTGQGYGSYTNVPQTPLDAIGDAPGNRPKDQTLIQDPAGHVFIVVGEVKFQFGSMTELSDLGYSSAQIIKVSQAPADAIPTASAATPPAEGTLLRSGGGQIYIIAGATKFHFGSIGEYRQQAADTKDWLNVPQGPLDSIGDAPGNMPRNGTILQRPDGALFVTAGGVRWYFGSMTEYHALGYNDNQILKVSQAPLDGIYDASASHLPANETLLQGTDSTLWVMKAGVRRSFTSMTQFTGMGYSTANIVRVPDGVLSGIPSGGNLP